MLIDTALLRRASLANLERLARALGIDLAREKRRARRECKAWHWALCILLAGRLRKEAASSELARLHTNLREPATVQANIVDVVRLSPLEGDTDGDDNDMGAED